MNEGIITQKPLNRKKSSLDFNEIVITKHFDKKWMALFIIIIRILDN